MRLNRTQQEFSALLGISPNTQRAYEHSKGTMSVDYLRKAESLGVNATYVLSGRLEQENCLDNDEYQLVTLYRQMAKAHRVRLLGFAEEELTKT